MKFTFLVPRTLNDGSSVSAEWCADLEIEISVQFAGCSIDGPVKGIWTNDAGMVFHDVCDRYTIVADRDRLNHLFAVVDRIAAELKQEAMFVEIDGYDGVQIRSY